MYRLIEVFFIAFTIGLTGALAPGPTLVATINSSLKGGWIMGPKVILGHMAMEVVVFLLVLRGVALAAESYSRAVALVGGLALVAFGALTIKGSAGASISRSEASGTANPYLAGVLTSAANPYFWIWWLSIGSALILDSIRAGLIFAAAFMAGHWAADLGWYTLVAGSVQQGRNVLSERSYRRVLGLCGAFLMLFGIYYLTRV
ncbi:MAG: LysE family transporter [Methanosarcinales archaeon]|nr:LysE family transporter [Methanosarcinales archaeon]